MRPNIQISHALNGRVKDYAAENDLTAPEAYEQIIEAGLEALEDSESDGQTGGEASGQEDGETSGHARDEDNMDDEEPTPTPDDPQIEAIVDAVAATWDDDDRLQNRKAAARDALAVALDEASFGKSHDLVDQLREQYPVEGQSRETYWRQNIRAIFAAMPSAEYSRGKGAYEVAKLCEVDELELE